MIHEISVTAIINYAIAIIPFVGFIVVLCVRLERRITRIEIDTKWIKLIVNKEFNCK